MEYNLQTSRKRRKNIPPDSLLKRRRLSKESGEQGKHRTLLETALTDDWQLTMGASLAERLERITSEKKLTVPQVKRLLKIVLTNEDVVAAFRHFMDGQLALLEPETGEPSSATRRQAHLLGVDPTALSRCSGGSAIENPIVHRVLTRSVAKKIRSTLRSTATPKVSRTRCTLQDMIFPDDDDDAVNSNATSAAEQSDSDYQPTALDMEILQLDRLYDRLPESSAGVLSADSEEDDNQQEEETSLEIMPSADSAWRSEEDDDDDNDGDGGGGRGRRHRYFTRSCQVKVPTNEDISDTQSWIHEYNAFAKNPSLLMQDFDSKEKNATDEAVCCEYEAPGERETTGPLGAETVCLSEDPLPSPKPAQNVDESIPTDPDDHIYSNFLRSLFSPGGTPQNDNSELPGESSLFLSQSNFGVLASPENFLVTSPARQPNTEHWNADDFDDPDFDVMAEIDNVCSEDLFDELRNDRAVRVSKMEAKELRRDLTELFMEDDEEYDEEVDDEEPNQKAHGREQRPSSVHQNPTTNASPSACLGSETAMEPISITLDMADRVKRQLSMHLQLLASTFVATINLSDLEETLCRPITTFVDQIHATLHRSSLLLASLSSIRNLLPLVNETRKFVHEFAGLSILPCFSSSSEDRAQLLNTPSIPLPFFLMDYILRSALWPYPDLLPPGLASPKALVPPRQRGLFTADEDGLIVLGIANFAEASPKRFAALVEHCNSDTPKTAAGDKSPRMHSSFFRFVATNLLPTRTPRQLYCRKCYIDFFGRLLTQRKSTGFGPGNSTFSSRSPLGLLLQDFQSPDFASVEAKLDLLRSCVPAFARQTSSYRRTYALGSIFSRPDVWHRLPAEYRACTSSLARQMTMSCLLTSAPVPTRDCLNVRFHASSAITHFFDEAMLSWWPSLEDLEGTAPADPPPFPVSAVTSSLTSSFAVGNPVISGNLVVITSLPCVPVEPVFQVVLPPPSITVSSILPPSTAVVSHQPAKKVATTPYLSRPPFPNHPSFTVVPSRSAFALNESPAGCSLVQTSTNVSVVCQSTQTSVATPPSLTSRLKSTSPKPPSIIPPLARPFLPLMPSQSQLDITLASKATPGTASLRPIAPAPPSKPVEKSGFGVSSVRSFSNKPSTLLPHTTTMTINSAKCIRWKRRKSRLPLSGDNKGTSAPVTIPSLPTSETHPSRVPGITAGIVGGFRRISPRPPNIPRPHITGILCTLPNVRPAAARASSRSIAQSPDVVKFIQSFNQSLDRVRSTLAGAATTAIEPTSRRNATTSLIASTLSTSNSRPVVAKFLRRCGCKKNGGGSDDLLLMTRSRRSGPSMQLTWGREADEADVLYARTFLDRCRVYLSPAEHSLLVTSFSDLSNCITDHCREQAFQSPPPLLKHLSTVLNCLAGCRPLWEDFVCLLTPEQARALRLFPVYAHTSRVRSLQMALNCLIPSGKRFWCRLRKLANSREPEEMRVPVLTVAKDESIPQHPHTMTSNWRAFRRRTRRPKPKSIKEVLKSAWSLLESSLRSRYVFLAQASACLEPNHRPYSNFPQAFEVVDSLARRPDPSATPVFNSSVALSSTLPRLVDEMLPSITTSAESSLSSETFRWEISTELASCTAAGPASALLQQPGLSVGGAYRLSKATTARQCPCPCHDHQPAQKLLPVTAAVATSQTLSTSIPSGKPAKVDSLGLRHCIKCSLRVHQGVVFVDECNFHLNHVQITWPSDFAFQQPVRSRHRFVQSNHATGSAVSTRVALESLAAYCLDPLSAPSLPDMARRQVAVQFGTTVAGAAGTKGGKTSVWHTDENEEEELDAESAASSPVASPSTTSGSSVSSAALPLASRPVPSPPSATWSSEVDDEAACFNTEAFSRNSGTRPIGYTSELTVATTGAPWSLAEDRRLLEYCRGAGSYSRVNLVLLASVWPERTLPEIVNRFKYLMRIALGEEDQQTHMFDSATESSQSSPTTALDRTLCL